MGEKGLLTGGERWWDAPIHFTLVAGIVFGASLIIYVATAAWETQSPTTRLRTMVQPAPPAQPGLKDYRMQSALLLALTAAVVAMFW